MGVTLMKKDSFLHPFRQIVLQKIPASQSHQMDVADEGAAVKVVTSFVDDSA